ncbi:M14 family zinc carboxypeptidase [Euzebya rosea]|uniref:M14 family zinc carboxypeptidase n=1 Tax=Euzebya rosea TaxID=2052804 RepID=UPI000D3E79CC|nr:M14 family zinc carboxypeptidase [Euzebya rosea]
MTSTPLSSTPLSRRSLLGRAGVAAAGAALPLGAQRSASAASPTAGSASVPGRTDGGPLQLARVWFGEGGPTRFDTTHRVFEDGSVEVVLWPGDLDRLVALDLKVELTDDDLALTDAMARASASGRPVALPIQPGEVDGYRTVAAHEDDLRRLAAEHPTTARLVELPFITFEGRTVLGLEIARNVHAPNDGRPTFHVDGLHHAREWPAGELAIMFAHDLLESDGTDARVTRIVDRVRTIVVPVVNPDGYHHSRSAVAETPGGTAESIALGGRGAYWRKNRRSFTDYFAGDGLLLDSGHSEYPEPLRGSDAYGVDPNRNYACTWGRPGSSANDVHSQSHRGDAPFSEPESRNIAWLMTTRHVTGALSHHTGAVEIIWPWANEMGEAPDADTFLALAEAMSAINGYRARKFNTSEGTTPDHFYGSTSTLCFLFENASSFHPDYASTVPALYATNRDAFLLLAERTCVDSDLHAVVAGRIVDADGNGVQATLTTRKRYGSPLWLFGDGNAPGGRTTHEEVFEASMATAADGTFEWHVNPSTRPHVQQAGATESVELAVSSAAGGTVRHLVLGRGEHLDLGDLQVI